MATEIIASLRGIKKTYHMGTETLDALGGIDLEIASGEYLCIMGPSGGGKSTLLNILGCLDRPSEGTYILGGNDVSELSDDALSEFRGNHLGFIFQSYNLIQQFTVVENIEVPLFYQGIHAHESRERAIALAEKVGLGQRLEHKPFELSGGQQQRVGVARALVNNPIVILADEPTGNLDSKSGGDILNLIDELHKQGKTILVVTHDDDIGKHCERTVYLRDGLIEFDRKNR